MARNSVRLIRLAICLVCCLSIGCGRTAGLDPVKIPTVGSNSLGKQKAGEVAELLSQQDIPQKFLLRRSEDGTNVKLVVFENPADLRENKFPEWAPVITSIVITQESVSLSKGANDSNVTNPISPKAVQGFFKWYFSMHRPVYREDYVSAYEWDEKWGGNVSFTVWPMPTRPDDCVNATVNADGTLLSAHPCGA